MKLCHIVPSLEEQHGGPSKSVHALCAALADAGHDIDLFTTRLDAPRSGDRRLDGKLRITTFQRDWPDRLCRSVGLCDAVANIETDVMHHHAIWLRTLDYARRGAARSNAKLVISPRGMMSRWAWRHHRWRKQVALNFIHPGALSAADGWHVTSPEEENELRELGFDEPICIAPNGVEAPSPENAAAATAYWHEECPEIGSRRVALFYSRFHPKKRVLELIDLWLEHAPADWILLLVGITQDYSPEMLDRYVMNMSGSGRVRIFDGIGRPPPYGIASLFLLPSHNENFGMSIAEAMAHGVPAVVTDTTPWSGLNTDHRGWCVPWSAYAAAIREATAESDSQLRARGEKARTWVLAEFSWTKSAKRLADFYLNLRSDATIPSQTAR